MMIKRTFYYVLVLVLIAGWCNGQRLTSSIFWEISGNDLGQPSYLLGTHHLYSSDAVLNIEEINHYFLLSDHMVGEVAIDPSMMLKVATEMMMKGQTLEDLLSKEDYRLLDAYLKKELGMGVSVYKMFKPIALNYILEMRQYMQDPSPQMDLMGASMDMALQKKAKELDKDVAGLETLDDQLNALFGDQNMEEQINELMKTVKGEKEEKDNNYEELNQLYKDQNLNKLGKLTRKGMSDKQYQSLLVDRNQKWIPKMEHMMKKGKVFFAVGAAHLTGKEGLIVLLRDKGYTLKPIRIRIKD